MAERPILFSGPMVRAILAGKKTQTRRVVKPQPEVIPPSVHRDKRVPDDRQFWWPSDVARSMVEVRDMSALCPFGTVGDRLWVRETHAIVPATAYRHSVGVEQRVNPAEPADAAVYREGFDRSSGGLRWRPSIHMPRWASRIMLEVTGVRVERLQDISVADAEAEGLSTLTKDGGRVWKYGIPDRDGFPGEDNHGWPWHQWRLSPVDAFEFLWGQINGDRGAGWDANPWVWVIEFTIASEVASG